MTVPPLHTCVRDGEIVCPDDLCRGSSHTLCGLEEGIDFGDRAPQFDDAWDDEDDQADEYEDWKLDE